MHVSQAAFQLAAASKLLTPIVQPPYSFNPPRFYSPKPLQINCLFNNQAFGPSSGTADFDGHGASFAAAAGPRDWMIFEGIQFIYNFTSDYGMGLDNVIADGQVIPVALEESQAGFDLLMLYAGDGSSGDTTVNLTFTFESGKEETRSILLKNWKDASRLRRTELKMPYYYNFKSVDNNETRIDYSIVPISSTSRLQSIQLPFTANSSNRMHIFDLTIVPTYAIFNPIPVSWFKSMRGTLRWEKVAGCRTYIYETMMVNTIPQALSSMRQLWIDAPRAIWIGGRGIRTVRPGTYRRLMPGDHVRIETLFEVENAMDINAVDDWTLEITDAAGKTLQTQKIGLDLHHVPEWFDRLPHETPKWFDQAKFGIKINWGLFSVPAFSARKSTAEHYWWDLLNPANEESEVWKYHNGRFGKNVTYDDFIQSFTGSEFSPHEWMKIITSAGAKYFVMTAKHHDGFTLFDSEATSHRSSVELGPRRDFLGELFNETRTNHPSIRAGVAFSLSEWFNPDFEPYARERFPGRLARNPFDETVLDPYTGRNNVSDYLNDVQYRQLQILTGKYQTDLLWCEAGGANLTRKLTDEWFDAARERDQQVVLNDRCGDMVDFETLLYSPDVAAQSNHWEASEGIDPTSFAYNRATNDDEYLSTTTIIHHLVDTVSKNGNYLLNIGPDVKGSFPGVVVQQLKEVGTWLKHSDACIYPTESWRYNTGAGEVRFTTTTEYFCIISLSRPAHGFLEVPLRVPILDGDRIELLGAPKRPEGLPWKLTQSQTLVIEVSEEELDSVQHAWSFIVLYRAPLQRVE